MARLSSSTMATPSTVCLAPPRAAHRAPSRVVLSTFAPSSMRACAADQDGEHKGRKTAFEITVPIGSEKKRPPRRRGRNAGKAADAESEEIGAERQSAADATEKGEGAGAPASDKPGGKGEGGGRDGKTHRRPHSGNRSRRNDKGVAGDKPKPNSTKDPKKDEAKQAARDSAKGE